MREVLKFGDAGESLWQKVLEGEFTKLFCIKDSEGGVILDNLVPKLKDSDPCDFTVGIKGLQEADENQWLDDTGLAYIPVGFTEITNTPKAVLKAFNLLEEEEVTPTAKDNTQESFKEYDHDISPVEDLKSEVEGSREIPSGGSKVDCLMNLVQGMGEKVYNLSKIEAEQDKIRDQIKELEDKWSQLEDKKQVHSESAETFKLCIRSFLDAELEG